MPAEEGSSQRPRSSTAETRVGELQPGRPYDPRPRREKTRSWLALGLVGLLAILACGLVAVDADGLIDLDAAKDLAGVILTPLIALTGTALGFYFGGHHGGDST